MDVQRGGEGGTVLAAMNSFSGLNLENSSSALSPDSAEAIAKRRVRRGYSGRSTNFLTEANIAVGKVKLRGPSGAHLPPEQTVKTIHLLSASETTGEEQNVKTKSEVDESSKPDDDATKMDSDLTTEKRPRTWTKSEDEALSKAVANHGEQNWKVIAECIPGRNSTQCIQRWKKVLKPGLKKGHWSAHEDAELTRVVQLQLAEKVKRINWSEACKTIPKRSSKQCRERWVNHLNPEVNKGEWTPEEDEVLWELQKEEPRKWALLARKIPGRTENQVKVRWNILNRHRGKYGSGRPEDLKSKRSNPRMQPSKIAPNHQATASIMAKTQKLAGLGQRYNTAPAAGMTDSLAAFSDFMGMERAGGDFDDGGQAPPPGSAPFDNDFLNDIDQEFGFLNVGDMGQPGMPPPIASHLVQPPAPADSDSHAHADVYASHDYSPENSHVQPMPPPAAMQGSMGDFNFPSANQPRKGLFTKYATTGDVAPPPLNNTSLSFLDNLGSFSGGFSNSLKNFVDHNNEAFDNTLGGAPSAEDPRQKSVTEEGPLFSPSDLSELYPT